MYCALLLLGKDRVSVLLVTRELLQKLRRATAKPADPTDSDSVS